MSAEIMRTADSAVDMPQGGGGYIFSAKEKLYQKFFKFFRKNANFFAFRL